MQEATGQSSQLDEFVKAANRYVQLMRGHIEKENLELFKFGDSILPSIEQMRILNAFEIFEEQVMGAGTHDKLHSMLDRFEMKYL